MAVLHYAGPDGRSIPVTASNPLPVTGGSGMEPADLSATEPATVTDNGDGTATIGVNVAAHVDPATGTVEDVVNSLIAAGLMAPA